MIFSKRIGLTVRLRSPYTVIFLLGLTAQREQPLSRSYSNRQGDYGVEISRNKGLKPLAYPNPLGRRYTFPPFDKLTVRLVEVGLGAVACFPEDGVFLSLNSG